MMNRYLLLMICLLPAASQALTLNESQAIALKNQPAIIAAQKKLEAANARLSQAAGAFLPTIKLEGNYGKSYTQPSTVQFTTKTATGERTENITFGTDAATDTRGWTASLSQPLFVAGLFPGLNIAVRSRDMEEANLRKAVMETAFNVTQAYFGVLKAGKMVKLSEESRGMAQTHLNQVQTMAAAGAATLADRLRAEVQLANSEVALSRAKNAREIAKGAFNNALGREIEEDVLLEEEGFSGAVARLPEYKQLLNITFENRPDWKQDLLSRELGEDNLRLARTAYLPTVFLTGQTGNRLTEYPTYRSDVNSWTLIGAASWTLFDGLGIQSRIREAAANLEAQKAAEEQVRSVLVLEVRDAYLNLTSALETIGSSRKAVESAEESYNLSNLRFASGAGTNLEALDAQVALTQARLNYLQALFEVEIAKAKINKVVGKEII